MPRIVISFNKHELTETRRGKNGNSNQESEFELGLRGDTGKDWEARKIDANTLGLKRNT